MSDLKLMKLNKKHSFKQKRLIHHFLRNNVKYVVTSFLF